MIENVLQHLLTQGEFFLRILISGMCGMLIGYERKNRLKEAGIRTHIIVALGASLMMVISKYGFNDVLAEAGRADASRIASQIVTGVGFLGAGTIFVRKQAISGLTTAAGIWTTAGIGMALGAGMYSVGIATAVSVVLVQKIFHGDIRFLKTPSAEQLVISAENTPEAIDHILNTLKEGDIEVLNIKTTAVSNDMINLDIFAKIPRGYDKTDLLRLFSADKKITSIDF